MRGFQIVWPDFAGYYSIPIGAPPLGPVHFNRKNVVYGDYGRKQQHQQVGFHYIHVRCLVDSRYNLANISQLPIYQNQLLNNL